MLLGYRYIKCNLGMWGKRGWRSKTWYHLYCAIRIQESQSNMRIKCGRLIIESYLRVNEIMKFNNCEIININNCVIKLDHNLNFMQFFYYFLVFHS